jgi:hypothetical protein
MPDESPPKVQMWASDMQVNLTGTEYAAIKKTVCEAVGYADEFEKAETIVLRNIDRPKPEYRQPSIAYKFGCFLTAALVVVIFLSGLIKIGEVIWQSIHSSP